MRILQSVVASMAILAAVPGLPELAEDAMHIAQEGHSLHADSHDAEGESTEGHGCSDCSHCIVCHCHASPLLPPEAHSVAAAIETLDLSCPHDDETPDEGFSTTPQRPPRA